MTAASFDVDGICTPVCILKGSEANSFNVCLLALTVLDGQSPLCPPYSAVNVSLLSTTVKLPVIPVPKTKFLGLKKSIDMKYFELYCS